MSGTVTGRQLGKKDNEIGGYVNGNPHPWDPTAVPLLDHRRDVGSREKRQSFEKSLREMFVEVGNEDFEVVDPETGMSTVKKKVEWMVQSVWDAAMIGEYWAVVLVRDQIGEKPAPPTQQIDLTLSFEQKIAAAIQEGFTLDDILGEVSKLYEASRQLLGPGDTQPQVKEVESRSGGLDRAELLHPGDTESSVTAGRVSEEMSEGSSPT